MEVSRCLLGAAWLLAATLLADRRALREMLAVTAIAGGMFGALGVVEAFSTGAREWGSAAGPFENSSSLGSFLALAVFAGVAWATATRSAIVRATAGASVALALAGIAGADSRTGIAALLMGTAVALLTHWARTADTRRTLLAPALPLAAIGLTFVLLAGSTGALGQWGKQAVGQFGTDRDAIWNSAAAQIAATPLAGAGPEQFSAWITWAFDEGALSFNATYDPHNAIAGIALGGGVVALVLWLALGVLTMTSALGVYERAGGLDESHSDVLVARET